MPGRSAGQPGAIYRPSGQCQYRTCEYPHTARAALAAELAGTSLNQWAEKVLDEASR
ncbi:toxin-antitoxin system HicB family antitoxin [Acetobacter sicerae]|uniref:toxin-antitoxin system HicB family antitoxin n=1 Tax=Acetobacter sicerae TaxID=85325 RepID=UPI0030CCCDBA